MEMVDRFTAATRQPPQCSPETVMCPWSFLMPWASPEPRTAPKEAGAGYSHGSWQRGTPNWFQTWRQSLQLQEDWRKMGLLASPACETLALGLIATAETPSFTSCLYLFSSAGSKGDEKQRGWAVCCLVAQGYRQKGEEGAVLFKAASSSIPRGGILPLECWLLCRKDLKSTYTKMIIKT